MPISQPSYPVETQDLVTHVGAYTDTVATAKAPLASPTFTGTPAAPTPSPGDNDTSIATTAFVTAAIQAAEAVNVVAATGATETLPDPLVTPNNHLTLDANCTLTFPTPVAGASITLALKQDATGSRTVTWPGTVKWPNNNTAPTLTTTAGRTDVFVFISFAGTAWLGVTSGANYA